MERDVRLLVDPVVGASLPVNNLVISTEPQLDLLLCALHSVGTVAYVPADFNAVVSTDGTRAGLEWVCLTQHDTSCLNNVLTLPHHRDDRSGAHVLDKSREERLGGEVSVVFLEQLLRGPHEFHSDQLKALLFEALDDFADKAAMDAIGLDHDEGSLFVGGHYFR